MQDQRLGNLLADGHHRIERRHRLLEDHRDLVAAHAPHLLFADLEEIAPAQLDRTRDDAARRIGDEPHQRQRRHALAAARFAHDCQGLARSDVEVDAVDRLDDALPRIEPGAEVFDLEKSAHERCLGSRMSRRALSSKVTANTVMLMATPGKMTSHGAVRTYSAADSDSMRPHDG